MQNHGWFQSRYLIKWFVLALIIFFTYGYLKRYWTRGIKYFATAKGKIHLEEINENVFKANGYLLIKNDLIPILKKENPQNCENTFNEWEKVAEDNGLTLNPPKELPNSKDFLLNDYSILKSIYLNDVPNNENETSISIWNETLIESWINTAKEDPSKLPLVYGNECLAVFMATKYYNIQNQTGAVIGSLQPWVEAYILANGAKNLTTIEYKKINITHPQMNFIYAPDLPELRENYQNYFDFIVSFSSIEHSGLGRYGDPMDPIGDIREMNKIHCLLKKDGLLFVGFPVGMDTIYYNANRMYGRIRLAMMFEGFELLDVFYGESSKPINLTQEILEFEDGHAQYMFVLKKIK